AVHARLLVRLFRRRADRLSPFRERPFVLEIAAPGPRPVERHFLARPDQMMGPRDRDQLGSPLALIRLPEEGVPLFDPPFAGGLPLRDVEMKVRPSAAAAFLPQDADLPSHRDLDARAHPILDELEMAVAVVPAPRIQEVDDVIPLVDRRVLLVTRE